MRDAGDPPEQTGWNRIKAVAPVVLTAALFALGLYALDRLLAPVNLADVIAQVRATPSSTLLIALLTTFGGYAALVGYDWSGLRHIGKRLPLRVVFLGGFLGYAFGNTIGLSAVSGGAVRYRIYAALGLDGYDVAAISTFAAMAYGVGSTVIGLGALTLHPEALLGVLPLDAAVVRWGSGAILAALLGLLAYISARRSAVRVGRFTIGAPSPGIMAGQMLFTAFDVGFAAMTLFVLLPPGSIGYPTLLAVFAAATMIGILSHVPGGVGVFESVVIAALPSTVPLEQAAAALLLYRLIYFLVPFGIALVVLSLNEVRMAGRWLGRASPAAAAVQPVFRAVSSVVPLAMTAMVFGSGLWMLIAALVPNVTQSTEEMEKLLPLAFFEGGALLSSAIGSVLIIVAHGLMRRSEGAYLLALGALVAGAVAALVHGLDVDRAGLLLVAALVLLPCRREFYRTARLTRRVLTPDWLILIGGVLIAGAFVVFYAHKGTPYANELWWQFAINEQVPRAMRAGLVASLALVLGLLVFAMRPPKVKPVAPDQDAFVRLQRIIDAQTDPMANLVFSGDKALLMGAGDRAFIMYGVQGRSWVALGEPIGARDEVERLAWGFADAAMTAGARPVFYEVSDARLPLWIDMGLALHKLGEEAVVDLQTFDLSGSRRARLRTTHNRALRDGLDFALFDPPHAATLLDELKIVSDAWLADKRAREKRFSVGQFSPAYLRRFPLALVRHNGRIVGFANVLTTARRETASIDLMRHLPDAPSGVMEFLFVDLMLALKAQGYRSFSLGMAPLSGLEARRGAKLWPRFGALLFRHGGHFYNFEGLRAFKEKFDPDWRPRYLACPTSLPPLAPLADVAILISGGLRASDRR